jgi:CelD/BcsL family acetyltransferase involved in cellulose biosynthesis
MVWNKFASQVSNDISLTFEWHWALWKARLQGKDVRVVWIKDRGELVGIFPFYVYRRQIRNISLHMVVPIAQIYTNHDTLLLRDVSLEMIRRILHFLQVEGYHWQAFEFLTNRGSLLYTQCTGKSKSVNPWLEFTLAHNSPYLLLTETADKFLSKQTSNFRYNIRRKTRSLEETGKLELSVFTDKATVHKAFAYLREIEKKSWKEMAGSSITARQWEEDFYNLFSPLAAERAWLRIYVLLLNDEPIAYDYGALYKNRYFMLKTSYVEHYGKFSPGTVLRWKVIQDLYSCGVQEHDFLGESDSYKMAWTQNAHSHASILLYNTGFYTWIARVLGKVKKSAKFLGISSK